MTANQNRVLKIAAADLAAQTGTAALSLAMTLRAPTLNTGASFGSITIH